MRGDLMEARYRSYRERDLAHCHGVGMQREGQYVGVVAEECHYRDNIIGGWRIHRSLLWLPAAERIAQVVQ